MSPTPLQAARTTLRRAEHFLRDQSRQSWFDEPWSCERRNHVRARLLGNWLREIDGLLHVVMDEVARESGTAMPRNQRNTANKLAAMTPAVVTEPIGGMRLRALARSRSALYFTRGLVTRPDRPGGGEMRVGWTRDDPLRLHTLPLGDRIILAGGDLRQVCDFYGDTADRVCATIGAVQPR